MFYLKDLLFSISLAVLFLLFTSKTFAGDAPLVLSSDGKVNIKQVLQMTPQSNPPSDPVDGDFYYTINNELLFYTNGEWNMVEFHSHNWEIGNWAACSVSCGGGTQTRSVICRRGDGQQVPDSYCGTKPAISQTCNTEGCIECCYSNTTPHFKWYTLYTTGGFVNFDSASVFWNGQLILNWFERGSEISEGTANGYKYTKGPLKSTGANGASYYEVCRQPL